MSQTAFVVSRDLTTALTLQQSINGAGLAVGVAKALYLPPDPSSEKRHHADTVRYLALALRQLHHTETRLFSTDLFILFVVLCDPVCAL